LSVERRNHRRFRYVQRRPEFKNIITKG